MSKKSTLYNDFYRLKKIENKSKSDIISILNLTPSMYVTLLDEIKSREITEINTDVIEKLVLTRLNLDPSSLDNLKLAMEVWKAKPKVKDSPKADKDDTLAQLLTNSRPTPNSD